MAESRKVMKAIQGFMVQLPSKGITLSREPNRGTMDEGMRTVSREVAQIEPGGRDVGHGSAPAE